LSEVSETWSPIAITAPTGWTEQITNEGTGDGYGILWTANSSTYYVQAGSSMNFSFTSADTPSSVDGNSVYYPGKPVGESFVYPQGAYSDEGHIFDVMPLTGSSPPPKSTPLVTVASVRDIQNNKHQVTQIDIVFSGPVNATQADSGANYRLVQPGTKGSFTARNAKVVNLKSAVYVAALNEVILTPKKPFALTKAVQLTVNGSTPAGVHDSSGRLIDGGDTGHAGSDDVVVISRTGVN
jgi:hypothetical protein